MTAPMSSWLRRFWCSFVMGHADWHQIDRGAIRCNVCDAVYRWTAH